MGILGKIIGAAAVIIGAKAVTSKIKDGKKQSKRDQLMESLNTLQDLYNKGAITDKEYADQKDVILDELKNL